MTIRCSRCDIAHEETSRCPTELEYERGYRAGCYQGHKESLELLSNERRAVVELEKHVSAAECGNVALRARLTDLTARIAESEAENKKLRLQNMDLREIAMEQELVYWDDCGDLRFTDSRDLVGEAAKAGGGE